MGALFFRFRLGVIAQIQRAIRHQGGVVHRCVFGERLVLVDFEAELAQVPALVLERHRIDHRIVGRRQAVGGDDYLRRRLARTHLPEHFLRLIRHHQIGRLQQHLLLGIADQRLQLWRRRRRFRRVLAVEQDVRKVSRQSLVLRRALTAGERVREDDLTVQRPGTGIPAADITKVVGRTIAKPLPAGSLLTWDMLHAA